MLKLKLTESQIITIYNNVKDSYGNNRESIYRMLLDLGVRPKDLRKFSFDSIETGPKRDVYFGLPKVREDINGNEYRREDNNDLSNGRTNTNDGIEYLKSSTGEVLGWVEDGKIHLIKGKFDTNTLIYEYAHLWLKALKLGNKEQQELYRFYV